MYHTSTTASNALMNKISLSKKTINLILIIFILISVDLVNCKVYKTSMNHIVNKIQDKRNKQNEKNKVNIGEVIGTIIESLGNNQIFMYLLSGLWSFVILPILVFLGTIIAYCIIQEIWKSVQTKRILSKMDVYQSIAWCLMSQSQKDKWKQMSSKQQEQWKLHFRSHFQSIHMKKFNKYIQAEKKLEENKGNIEKDVENPENDE